MELNKNYYYENYLSYIKKYHNLEIFLNDIFEIKEL